MKANEINIRSIVPRGGVARIAKELGITAQAVSLALKAAKPSHPAVRLALSMAEASGALVAAQQLAKLTPIAQAA
jgi:predicted transcriptional regulator